MDQSIKIKTEDSQNSSLLRDRDTKLKLFENIVYFASGSISHEVLSALKNSKAESTCLLSDSVTHCIVGDNYVDDDVTTARDLYDVITVTPEWIRMSVICNKLLPTKPFNPFEENLFRGVVVCASQLTVNDCKTIWALVTYNGGNFRLTLDLSKTTHLVITKPYGKKYESVLSNSSDKIKIVTPDWIIDCLKNKELCSETNYHPRLLVMPKLPSTNQSFKLQTSGLSTITGFVDFDAPIEQPGAVVPKNQGLEQLKQRLPWNQPSTPPTSQTIQAQVSQGTVQSNNTQPKTMMSLISTPQLQRLSQQQVQQLQLQQQTHASNQLLSQQQMHMPQSQNQFQQQIRTQQMQQSKQIQLQHGQQLQFQSSQQQLQQNHMQLQQGQSQTHLQMMQKGQQQLQQNQQHIHMQQKVQQIQSGQQLQSQQQQVNLQQQQNVQLQQSQQQQQNVQQLQPGQQPNQIPQLQQQTVQIQQGQLSQLQQQTVQIQQGQQQVQMSQLQQQQQTVQLQQSQQQQGQLSQLQKQTVQLQQNQQHSNQLQQTQQIQPQQIQFQTSNNNQQVQFPQQQQVTPNAQVHIQQQQQQQQPQIQNVQSTQPSQICIVSNGQQVQQVQQAQGNPSNQQLLIQQQQQRLLFQQRIVQQGGGTVSTQWRMAHPSSNMPRVQANQQQTQQIPQQQTLVIGQQQTVNMNAANNTQPTTQTQWPQPQTLTIQRTIQQPLDQRQVIWSQQSPHGPQQMIHMDAKTHQQIQAMNPAERLAFINKLTKQRNLVLQQFNARQQQAAGVTGGTNIIRPSTPNGPTTVIRTLNHQLISTSGMTQAQQAQWNQIRQQQVLAQQQQHMAGGTVSTGLPTNVKTVSNPMLNNQQVVQPQTTVWQQSSVTEQAHQQTTGSMSPVQLAQLHQRQQQLQQLRLQQLQMDATQKQQPMQQQLVPNQPIASGVMQPNVVQSPQVAPAQTTIVQPQQTSTLPTNESTETQAPNQEPFAQTSQSNQQALVVNPKTKTALANMLSIRLQNGISSSTSIQQQQMSGQEISAAGQLRLMTAQHHAAQHQNQQQAGTQGAYQSRTVLNNVTNNGVSNRAAQVVGRAAAQTVVANKSLPANYNQSAAVRVAAVLAKSAAGQAVGHHQLPHQARFFGHNPNLKLPPDKCLLGCIFLIVEYDRCSHTSNEVSTWKQIILEHGGEIEPSYTLRLTHILCQTQKHPLVQQGLRDGKRCITAYWLSDIITKQQLMPPWYALHFPTPYSEERPCRHMLISLTNFEGEERNRVKFMIELTGARVTSYLSADNNILVSKKLEGKKVKKARDTNRPVVNVQWLNEILFGHLSCMYQPENAKYQQFNLNNPFRVDYNLVLHLMGAWKIPINVTQESYDRVRNNPVVVKRKRPRPCSNLPDFIDQENNDLSMADIIITNINPPPIEYRPCVMLSGFGLGKEEQRMILQLGGTIAKNYSDATHLVMKESVRTTKFLCCVSTVKHIVNADWLKDSSTQHMFLGEAIYTIEEVSVDQKVICKVHKILSNPNRHELFKGKIFYVTPGVSRPSVHVIRQIIESAGGNVEKQRRSLRAIQELEPNTYIVIACNNDLHLVADLIRSFYGIYSSEFVLTAVMTQYVNYDTAYKKPKKIIN